MNNKVILTIRKILIALLIIWMVVVFLLSNQKGTDSSGLSKKVALILSWGDEVSADKIEPVVRKVAHIIEYAVGAMLFYGILCTYQKFKLMGKIVLTILFIVAYAGTDELHQLFIDSRNGSLIDVGIDTLGGTLGVAGCYFVERVTKMIDNRVKEELSSNNEK